MSKPQPIEPQPGQESVWDYPRPPLLKRSLKRIEVMFNQVKIAESVATYRVLETSHPPVYYIPPQDIQQQYLQLVSTDRSFCEWKGLAGYYDLVVAEQKIANAGWFYPEPTIAFAPIRNYVAFYPAKMDACYVDGELVTPQSGDFYGGWITSDIVGPFKGDAQSWGW